MTAKLPAEQSPTIETVALAAKVSISTVSRALRNDRRLPKTTCERIQKVALELGYRPNPLISTLMAHLRTTRPPSFQSTLAFLQTSWNPQEAAKWSSMRHFVAGATAQAGLLGYKIESFWLHEPGVTPAQWQRIFKARGICGLIIVYLPERGETAHQLEFDLSDFAIASLGMPMQSPAISFSSNDHYATAALAVVQARKAGYQRIGLVLDTYVDEIVDHKFLGAYLGFQQSAKASSRLRPLVLTDWMEKGECEFQVWLRAQQPDVIVTISPRVVQWLAAAGQRVPEDVGVITLEWHETEPEISGVNQKNDLVGAAAVDLIAGQLNRNERGVPKTPKALLIEGQWVPGTTVRRG